MNRPFARILAALWLIGAWGVATQPLAADNADQQNLPTPKPTPTQDAEPQAAETAAASAGAEQPAPETAAAAEDASTAEKKPEPITGAFGIPLGKRFDPGMVAKVIGQEAKSYSGCGKTKRKGTRYRVEPKAASEDFEHYSVDTNDQGIVYAIHGEYQQAENEKACKKVTKRLAAALEEKHGKPRGKSMLGEWYSFRDMTSKAYRGVRLYANRCGSGQYRIVYSDDQARKTELAAEPEMAPPAESGL